MKASLRDIRISPKKLNLVAELIRNQTVENADNILKYTPKRGAKLLRKLLLSAVANAENNFKQKKETLAIREVKVSKAFTLHRSIPAGKGSSRRILKYASHAHIYLDQAVKAEPKTEKPKKTTKSLKS